MEATVVNGTGTETGHIIVTTIGGRNGQPKQVINCLSLCYSAFVLFCFCKLLIKVTLALCHGLLNSINYLYVMATDENNRMFTVI